MTNEMDNAATVGDEPFQYFLKYGDQIKVCVGEERVLAIPSAIMESEGIEVFLLDDAYQHRKVARDFNILLSDYNHPFYDDFILPTGDLREGRKGAERADCIIITKCPNGLSENEKEAIQNKINGYATEKVVFFSQIKYGLPLPVLKEKPIAQYLEKVIMVTSIADNQMFKSELKRQFIIIKEFVFEDHHRFNKKDLDGILKFAEGLTEKESNISIITTEKDMVRLLTIRDHDIFNALGVHYIPIQFEIDRPKEFEDRLFKVIEEKKNLH
jgi:tetraacyldisaccharide 4'-kinase